MSGQSSLKIGATVETPASSHDVEIRYRRRIQETDVDCVRLARLDASWNVARIALTLALLPVGFFTWYGVLPVTLAVVLGLAVLGVAMWHDRILERLLVARTLRACHERQLARRQRRWQDVPVPAAPPSAAQLPVARDLDLFGQRSVFHWLCVAHTPRGRDLLAEWLVTPAAEETLAHRQRLVTALAAEFPWRESLQLHGSLLGPDADSGRPFVEWATGPGWLAQRRWLLVVARLAPAVALALYVAYRQSWIAPEFALAGVALLVFANLVLSVLYSGTIHDLFITVAGTSDQVGRYRDMLAVAARLPAHIGALTKGGDDLRDIAQRGIQHLSQLRRIVQVADARRDGLFGGLVVVAQLAVLWEVHVLAWLESWQRRHGYSADAWFQSLGELEALASLATAAHDHPDWTFPRIDPEAPQVAAQALGHPLLADEHRVTNDVRLGPAGTFLLVTGSNMSGKSTLLRSIGVNVVLGQAGGVVCARNMTFPPMEVQTSMRVSDSLADGVSLFFAELLRLKTVVDRGAEAARSGRVLLYLLDEILHGTNSRERQTAVARVLRHLVDHGAIGAISTHDLELATCPEIRDACQVVHFRETLGGSGAQRTMSFDYRLRPGLSPTTNALVLLEMVGLSADQK